MDDNSPDAEVEAFMVTNASAGQINHLSVYVTHATTATSLLVGVYTNNGGHPGTLLTSGTITAPSLDAWNTAPVTPYTVAATTYWIAVSGQGGTVGYRDNLWHGTLPAEIADGSYASLPTTWVTGKFQWDSAGPISGYAS
jgi:hypothetical protein